MTSTAATMAVAKMTDGEDDVGAAVKASWKTPMGLYLALAERQHADVTETECPERHGLAASIQTGNSRTSSHCFELLLSATIFAE